MKANYVLKGVIKCGKLLPIEDMLEELPYGCSGIESAETAVTKKMFSKRVRFTIVGSEKTLEELRKTLARMCNTNFD